MLTIILRQSAGNLQNLQVCINKLIYLLTAYLINKLKILRDYTYEFICFFCPTSYADGDFILIKIKEKGYKKMILMFKETLLLNNNLIKEEEENLIIENLKNMNIKSDSQLGYYLAGLIEGNGTIIVPTSVRSAKNVLNYPSIQIAFNKKDYPLACAIMNALDTGYISEKKGKVACVYTINTFSGIIKIVNLINGKLRTHKNKRL